MKLRLGDSDNSHISEPKEIDHPKHKISKPKKIDVKKINSGESRSEGEILKNNGISEESFSIDFDD